MKNIRSDFPILKQKINGHPLVYFDNAATSQKPAAVIDAVTRFYRQDNANVHRSINPLGERATAQYEAARRKVADFIKAEASEVIFTRNTTEGINLVARTWGTQHLRPGDIIVLSIAEHHSNIVPWLQLKNKIGIKLEYIPLDNAGDLDVAAAEKILALPNVKLLALVNTSNTLGTVFPIAQLIKQAKLKRIVTLIDAAQAVAHGPVDVQSLGCDFLVFSGHKMYGPTGIGVLWARQDLIKSMPEFLGGGEMITEVFTDYFVAKEPPYRFEAGTPHIAGAIGLAAAVDWLKKITWETVHKREEELREYLWKNIMALDFVQPLAPASRLPRLPLVSFTMPVIHPHDIADMLGEGGICVRAGHHCTKPLHHLLGRQSSVRASLAFYNTEKEIDIFVEALKKINKKFS